ncbi:MAG: TolC family protein [Myxococcales bacterium]|nr:TolC family protein [Myxococcales bacterium]
MSAGVRAGLVALVALALPRAQVHADPARGVTLDECLALALVQGHDVVAAEGELAVAGAARAGARAGFGPRVRVDGTVTRWSEALTADLSPPGALMPGPLLTIRDSITTSATLTVAQPVTGLWGLYEVYRIADLGVDVARAHREAARQGLVYQVTEAFYRRLEAAELAAVAVASVEQLTGHVERMRALEAQGLAGHGDSLRVAVALSSARQRLAQARGGVELAAAQLAFLVGLEPGAALEPVFVPAAASASMPPPSLADAEVAALRQRAELVEVAARIGQARAGADAARSRLVPQVALVGTLQLSGGSAFAEEQAYFAGLSASWEVWDWGAVRHAVREAKARVGLAQAGLARLEQAVRLEVRVAHTGVVAAAETRTVAAAARAEAEEHYRVARGRHEAGAGTTFDVVDAEALLTQARAQALAALYEELVARAALARAMGQHVGNSGSAAAHAGDAL